MDALKKARSHLGISRDACYVTVVRVKMIEREEVEWAEIRMGGDKERSGDGFPGGEKASSIGTLVG